MKKIAMVYDADYTLLREYHPNLILRRRGVCVDCFWQDVGERQKKEEERGETTNLDIVYLACFMNQVRHGRLEGLSIGEIKRIGREDLGRILYPGLPDFFEKIKKANSGVHVSHSLVSVGIKPLLEGSVLGDHMDYIFGYTFFDDLTSGEGIDEVKSTTSRGEKVSAITSISRGGKEIDFDYDVDDFVYPIKDMFYFGDGQTDLAAFRFVKRRGGVAVCVFDEHDFEAYDKAKRYRDDVNYVLPANYGKKRELWNMVIEEIGKRT